MKKILVPIDFSDYSTNAVKYAIEMAKTMKASIHLCHAIAIPEVSPMAGMVVWPTEDYTAIKEETTTTLKNYVDELKANTTLNEPFLPIIEYSCAFGNVKKVIEDSSKELKIDLVIMGMAGAGKLSHLLLGSNSLAVIADNHIPVLLVPKTKLFTGIHKVAFATALIESDLNSIQQLASLLYHFNTDILLTHVSTEKEDVKDKNTKIDAFLNSVTCKLNYPKIYFRHVDAKDVDEGLSWITKNTQIDLLAIIHRRLNIFHRIMEGSRTKNLANHIEIPLIVLPENYDKIGW
eukprot:Opistho-1_new@12618